MGNRFDDPRPNALIGLHATAHDLDEECEPDPYRGAAEHVGGPMEPQVDAANTGEDGEGARGDAEPPAKADRQECRDGEGPGRHAA